MTAAPAAPPAAPAPPALVAAGDEVHRQLYASSLPAAERQAIERAVAAALFAAYELGRSRAARDVVLLPAPPPV